MLRVGSRAGVPARLYVYVLFKFIAFSFGRFRTIWSILTLTLSRGVSFTKETGNLRRATYIATQMIMPAQTMHVESTPEILIQETEIHLRWTRRGEKRNENESILISGRGDLERRISLGIIKPNRLHQIRERSVRSCYGPRIRLRTKKLPRLRKSTRRRIHLDALGTRLSLPRRRNGIRARRKRRDIVISPGSICSRE